MENEAVQVGATAPDFELPALIAGVKKTLRLSRYRDRHSVIVAFYPHNWQEASAKLLVNFQAERSRLVASQAETVAITVDSIMNTTAWEREIGPLDFPLCSDFWPHGEVSQRYGVLRQSGPDAGASERAIFAINHAGRIVFRKVYSQDEVPILEEILPALETR